MLMPNNLTAIWEFPQEFLFNRNSSFISLDHLEEADLKV